MRYRLEPLLGQRATFTATVKEVQRSPQRNVFRVLLVHIHHQREHVTDHAWVFVSRHHPFTTLCGKRVLFTARVEPYLKHARHSGSNMLIDCKLAEAQDVTVLAYRPAEDRDKGDRAYA